VKTVLQGIKVLAMPRAHRHHIPGQVWYITYRRHQRKFLFMFVEQVKRKTGILASGRKLGREGDVCVLCEPDAAYSVHLNDKNDGKSIC